MTDQDDWTAARMAIVGKSPPDLKPMAAMLRRDGPIPADVRDLLAELLVPGKPEYLGLRLEIVSTQTPAKIEAAIKHREIIKAFWDKMAEGLTYDDAAKEIGEKYGKDERTIKRYLHEWKQIVSRLRGHGKNSG